MLDRAVAGNSTAPTTQRGQIRPGTVDGDDRAALSGAAILAILRRRKLALLLPMLIVPLLTGIAITALTPLYTASGTLIYDPSEYKLQELQSILREDPITDAVMATQAEVLRGMPVVEQVAARLNLHANPEFNVDLRARWMSTRLLSVLRSLSGRRPQSVSDPDAPGHDAAGPRFEPTRNATLQSVQEALLVVPVKGSHVLQVSFTAQDPVLAAAAVNSAMDVYVKSQLGKKYAAVAKAKGWLEHRAVELREEVRRQEDEIARYRERNGLVEGMHAGLDSEQISLLTENLTRARNSLAEAEGRLDAASGRTGAAAQAAIAPSVVQLRARQSQMAAELQAMLGRLGSSHPDVKSLRTQVDEAEHAVAAETARVVAAIEADVRAGRERVATLERNLRDAQSQLGQDAHAQVPLNAMQRDMEASRGLLQLVLERIQATAQQSAIEAPDAHEISLALPPDTPSFPRTGQTLAAAGAFGVLLGLLLVYVSELTDATFHTSDDIRAVLGLPCFALIPRIPSAALRHQSIEDYAARKPLSSFAEQLRALRIGLAHWHDPHVVAVTAARAKEGKTATTNALGRLAALNGERVVVVDCDIRRSSFGRQTRDESGPGLIECLQERASLADVLCRDAASGMDSIGSGQGEANALGLLMSAGMVRLLQTLRQDHDLVLLDAPPAQAITDARIVAGLADATLLCVRWRDTPRDKVLHALELLEEAHANVVGAALTQVDVDSHLRSGYADAEVYHPRYGGSFQE